MKALDLLESLNCHDLAIEHDISTALLREDERRLDEALNGWVRCSFRMPPHGQRVLFVVEQNAIDEVLAAKMPAWARVRCGYLHDAPGGAITWADEALGPTSWSRSVTHWRPLPEPPR